MNCLDCGIDCGQEQIAFNEPDGQLCIYCKERRQEKYIKELEGALRECKKEKERLEKELCAHDKDCAVWMERNFKDLSQDSNFSIIDMHDAFNAGKIQFLPPAEEFGKCD